MDSCVNVETGAYVAVQAKVDDDPAHPRTLSLLTGCEVAAAAGKDTVC